MTTNNNDTQFSIRKWARNWLILVLCILLAFVAGVGLDTTSGSIAFFEGFGTFLAVFGGILSFGALVGIGAILAGVGWGLYYMTKTDFSGREGLRWTFIIGGLAALFAAGLIGWSWVEMPSGMGWFTLILIVVTAFVAATFRNVREPKNPSTKKSRVREMLSRGRKKSTPVRTDRAPAPAPIPVS